MSISQGSCRSDSIFFLSNDGWHTVLCLSVCLSNFYLSRSFYLQKVRSVFIFGMNKRLKHIQITSTISCLWPWPWPCQPEDQAEAWCYTNTCLLLYYLVRCQKDWTGRQLLWFMLTGIVKAVGIVSLDQRSGTERYFHWLFSYPDFAKTIYILPDSRK